jgi:hypothetical protein
VSEHDELAAEYAREAQAHRERAEFEREREGIQTDRTVREESLLSRSLLDLDREPPKPISWLIEGLVPEGELTLLFGKPFGGKSLFSLQLGLHAAGGVSFLPFADSEGFRIPRRLRVLYVDEEMGLPLLWKRTRLMRSGREELNTRDALERFRVVSRQGLRLDDPARLDLLRREIADFPGGPAELVILDTLRRLHLSPEKDSELMARIMGTLIAIGEELGCAVLPIHHSKKGPADGDDDWREAARGSGDLVAASQSVIGMLKTGDCLFTARADSKAAGEINPFPLILDDQTLLYRRQTEDERFATKDAQHDAAVSEAKGRLCKALQKLKDRGGEAYPASWTAWREKAGGNKDTLAAARAQLLGPDDGQEPIVREINRTGRGGGKAYLFTSDAEAALFGTSHGTRPETSSQ